MGQWERSRERGFAMAMEYERTGNVGSLRTAVDCFREAVRLLGDGDPHKARDLRHLCTVLRLYYDATKELWALDESVAAGRAALAGASDPDDRDGVAIGLGIALYLTYDNRKDREALRESIAVLRDVADRACPHDANRLPAAAHLAVALRRAYSDTKDVALLREAVDRGRLAAKNPNTMQVPALTELVRQLRNLSGRDKDARLLDEAEQAARWAVHITESDRQSHAELLFELARTLQSRFGNAGRIEVLEEAARAAEASINETTDPVTAHLRRITTSGIFERLERERHASAAPPPPPPM